MDVLHYLVSGALLGLAAGVSPGPLLALVISETLTHSRREGVLVSVAPALTDAPIIAISLLIISSISRSDLLLGVISLAGASFAGYLAYGNMKLRNAHSQIDLVQPRSLSKGVITNLLSPHPYLFWMTVGAPYVIKASRANLFAAIAFMAGFYLLLIGSKILIALLVDSSKNFLRKKTYILMIRITGVIMLFFAILLLRDAVILIGLIPR